MSIFQRLVGLETEYALLLPGGKSNLTYSRYQLFQQFVGVLRGKIPTVDAKHMKEGLFHATGGAVWFETERPAAGGGLFEGATAECRSPRDLLAQQRAQDQLLAETAREAFGSSQIRLLKNDRDGSGNIYGAQENYSATLATGWRLRLWQAGLLALLPLAVVTWALLWIIALAVITYTLLAAVVYLTAERFWKEPQRLAKLFFGCEFYQLGQGAQTGPAWLELVLSVVTRVVTFPLAAGLFVAIWLLAFTPHRKKMTAFLASRSIISGSGMVDDAGRFHLASKGMALNCLIGYGGLLADRPLFTFGHFFKTVYADAWLSPKEYFTLLSGTQRLQIALGDSNLCERSEYLRIATTLLVLDCLEAGELGTVPLLWQPLKALKEISKDPSLTKRVEMRYGPDSTALEIQRFYLEACRRFVERRKDAPAEAFTVLELWEEALDELAEDPGMMIGCLDWITKQHLLDEAGPQATWETRKKLDLKYHELSPEGYYSQLLAGGVIESLLEPSEIAYARRNPPAGTPASIRGRYIREFEGGDIPISANWRAIYLGQGRETKIIPLTTQLVPPPGDGPAKDESISKS